MSSILSHLAAAACGALSTLTLLGPRLRQLHRRLTAAEFLAAHDPLTGLANRRRVLAHLREATRQSEQIGVILFNLDAFKAVNDIPGVGHAGGDELLRQIAHLLRTLHGPVRLTGRLGGDEFVVIVAGDADATAVVAHTIWTLITGAPFVIAGRHIAVAVSVGHVSGRLGWTGRKLLHYADLAMYDAKAAGGGVAAYCQTPADVEVADRPAQRCRDRRHPPPAQRDPAAE